MLVFVYTLRFYVFSYLFSSVCATGNATPGSDGCLEVEVKWITLSCQAQEVLGAKTDHLPGTGPASASLSGWRNLSRYISRVLAAC